MLRASVAARVIRVPLLQLCRLTSCALEHAILHTRLCFSPGPGDPHSCARTLPGSTDRASRSSITHPSWPSDQSANLYFWLTQSGPRFRRKPTFLDAARGRHLRRHWRPSSKLPVYLVHVIPRFCCRAALPFEHPSPSSPFFETVPQTQTPGGGKKGRRSRGVVHPSYNARHTTGLATDDCYIRIKFDMLKVPFTPFLWF